MGNTFEKNKGDKDEGTKYMNTSWQLKKEVIRLKQLG